jgi:AcrR family transcriptional regulator
MQEIKDLTPYRQSLRDRILDAAMILFAKHGIRAVKMDDVSHALSISKRTLYELYDNKEQVLLEGVKKYRKKRHEEFLQEMERSKDVMDIILYMYRIKMEEFQLVNPNFYSDLARYPNILASIERDHDEQHKQFMDFMQRGISEGYFRSDLNYDLIGRLFEALGRYMMENELYRSYSMEELFRNMIFVTLRGFCTKKGVDKLDTFFS